MGIVNDDIRIGMRIFNDPKPSGAIPYDLLIKHRTTQIPMSEQTESKEGICHPFREEDSPYPGGNFGERKPDAANDHVLENCGMLSEW